MGAGTQTCPPSARPAHALNHQAISLTAIQIFVLLQFSLGLFALLWESVSLSSRLLNGSCTLLTKSIPAPVTLAFIAIMSEKYFLSSLLFF